MRYAVLRIREGREGAEAYSLAFFNELGTEPLFELFIHGTSISVPEVVALARGDSAENHVYFGIELI